MDEKTLFDGRLHFHKEASDIRMRMYACAFNKDYAGWISCLDLLYGITCPYMDSKSRLEIGQKIDKWYQNVQMYENSKKSNANNFFLQKSLHSIFKDIMISTKKMWLPIEELNAEWDTDMFLKGTT